MNLTAEDQALIAKTIADAEKQTSGEIVCVLARSSSSYAYIPLLWAAAVGFAVPWPLLAFTQMAAQTIFLIQLLTFLGLALILSLPVLRMALVPRSVKRARAHRAAMEQFFTRGLTRTKDATGVLIFVSLAERYARIIADDGIAAKVPQATWQATINDLITHMRNDDIVPGFCQAIQACGTVLHAHFPAAENDTDELPNRIFLM